MPRIAINGFGRIGRTTFKVGWENPAFDVVAINDLTDAGTVSSLVSEEASVSTRLVAKVPGIDTLP